MDITDRRIPVTKDSYDVIVVGGGIGGIAAAVAAARNGAKTLLLEKQVNLGGLATVGLISWYEPLCDGMGNQVIGGICEELIRLSIRYGLENLPACWGGEGRNPSNHHRFSTYFSPTLFSLALDAYVRESGADLRFDALATYPIVEQGCCKAVVVETVSGKELYPCKMLIDATGDASVCAAAGLPTQEGTNYLVYLVHEYSKAGIDRYLETGNDCKLRTWVSRGGSLTGAGHPEDMPTHSTYNSDTENAFLRWGKEAMLQRYMNTDKNSRDIMALPTMPQYRKIRHLVGDATFLGETAPCPDSIGTCGDFRKSGPVHQLPYRCLYNSQVPNLLTAGRIISSDGEGWEITRVIPVCALTGQAAGTAAALCCQKHCTADALSVPLLQETLKQQGVLF